MKASIIFLYIFNLIFLIYGTILVISGSLSITDRQEELSKSKAEVAASFILICSGAFLVIISFLGCCGALTLSKIWLTAYCVFLSIILTLAFISVVTSLVCSAMSGKKVVSASLVKSIPDYVINDVQKPWDVYQKEKKCCGSSGFADWRLNVEFNKTNSVPDSCCLVPAPNCGQNQLNLLNKIHRKGCAGRLSKMFKTAFNLIALKGAVTAVIILTGLILASMVTNQSQKSDDYSNL